MEKQSATQCAGGVNGATEWRAGPAGPERRVEGDRRRGPSGWLEMRARRDGIAVDRRHEADRASPWARLVHALRHRRM